MERWIAMLLAAPMLFSCAMAETGGLDLNRGQTRHGVHGAGKRRGL